MTKMFGSIIWKLYGSSCTTLWKLSTRFHCYYTVNGSAWDSACFNQQMLQQTRHTIQRCLFCEQTKRQQVKYHVFDYSRNSERTTQKTKKTKQCAEWPEINSAFGFVIVKLAATAALNFSVIMTKMLSKFSVIWKKIGQWSKKKTESDCYCV